MNCPNCSSSTTAQLSRKTTLGYESFSCRECGRVFNERTANPFNHLQFPTDVVEVWVATELEKLRMELLETIAPAYEAGKTVAHNIWAATVNDHEREELQTTPPENVMTDAWQHFPGELSTSQANWFVEGFCYNWAQEWFAFQLSRF